jgi:hypothetical protein
MEDTTPFLNTALHDDPAIMPSGTACQDALPRRVMSYLRYLDLPAVKGLELSLETLRYVQQEINRGNRTHPITLGIIVLRKLLRDQNLFSNDGPPYGERFRYQSLCPKNAPDKILTTGFTSMPRLNRGFMVPQVMK